jgi:hypothetical protein
MPYFIGGAAKPYRLKLFLKTLLVLFIVLLTLMISCVALVFVYEKEVKAAIITEINKHLRAKVVIQPENIDLTIVSSFPDCSLQFTDLLMKEAVTFKKPDTLLFLAKLKLHFNVRDLWHKKYRITEITAAQGVVRPCVYSNGYNNYTFWVSQGKKTGDSVSFTLNKITLSEIKLGYRSHPAAQQTELTIEKLVLKGEFNTAQYRLASKGQLHVAFFSHKGKRYLKDKAVTYNTDLEVTNGNYKVASTNIGLNDIDLELKGNFLYRDSLEALALSYATMDLDIASALSLLPVEDRQKANDYRSQGLFYSSGDVSFKPATGLRVHSVFGINKGRIEYLPGEGIAENITLSGKLDYSRAGSSLALDRFLLTTRNDTISGTGVVTNFLDPNVSAELHASFHLENLKKLFPIDTITSIEGALRLNASVNGRWRTITGNTFSKNNEVSGDLQLNGLKVSFKNDKQPYEIDTCSLRAQNRDVKVDVLKMKRGRSDVRLTGSIPGLFNYLTEEHQKLVIAGTLYAEHIYAEDFIFPAKTSGVAEKLIPSEMDFRLQAAILAFSFGKFSAGSLTGELEIRNSKLMISDLKLSVMNGEAEIDALADNSGSNLALSVNSTFSRISISELFRQMNNFGQEWLTEKNIFGLASGTIDMTGIWNNQLIADDSNLKAVCNIVVDDGRLLNFTPLNSLSRFINVSDLQDVRFRKLTSSIVIADRTIMIPHTEIRNSALNIDFKGTHKFNSEINYHFSLLLNELLAKKLRRPEVPEDEEIDADNRRKVFLKMTGTLDNPKIAYDYKGLQEKVIADIRKEKASLKQILKEEFGLFKKDTLPQTHRDETYRPVTTPTAVIRNDKENGQENDEDF